MISAKKKSSHELTRCKMKYERSRTYLNCDFAAGIETTEPSKCQFISCPTFWKI